MRTTIPKVRLITLRSGAPDVEEWQGVLLVGGMVRAAVRAATREQARDAVGAEAAARGLATPTPARRRRFA